MKPWLARTHVGYYRIVLSVLISHVVLAVDCFAFAHVAPVFHFVNPLMGVYGVVHVIVAAVVTFALLADERWWWTARAAMFLSLLTFNTYAVGMLFGVFYYGGTLVGPVGLIALSISSAAAWREPTIGPAYRSIRHRAT